MGITDEPVRGGFPDPAFYNLSGMDQLRAHMRGLVARTPLSHLTGARGTQVGAGTFTGMLPATPWLQQADGTIEFKIFLAEGLEDAVLAGAPPGTEVRAAALSVAHLRRCTIESAPLVGRARVLHTGPNFTLAETTLDDALGRPVAHATAHVTVRPLGIESAPPPELSPVPVPAYATPDPYERPLPEGVGTWTAELRMGGRAVLDMNQQGKLPAIPILALTGIRWSEMGEGEMSLEVRASEWLCFRYRQVSGGVIASVAHAGTSAAAFTLMPAGHEMGILEQTVSLFRPVMADGRDVLCRARVVHQDGDRVHASAEVTDADGNRVALAHQTFVFVAGRERRAQVEPERVLATVLFTDIVGSTESAERLGDAKWREVLDDHHALVRHQLATFKGREVKTLGDGFLATFDSPTRAVQCARAIRDGVRRLGIEIRAGLHTGECEVVGADLAGIAVHVASRVQAAAQPGEILASSTVRDLTGGSGLRFADRGLHTLKGIDGDWHLLAVTA